MFVLVMLRNERLFNNSSVISYNSCAILLIGAANDLEMYC